MPRPEEHQQITLLAPTSAAEVSVQTERFRWRVRDWLFCSWRRLPDPYLVAEMWQMLRKGRFAKAVRIGARANKLIDDDVHAQMRKAARLHAGARRRHRETVPLQRPSR
jgi:hypothetical protein